MPNKAKRLAKSQQTDPLYNSLIGSIVCTIGIITGHTEKELRKTFNALKRNKQSIGNTVSEICDYTWGILGKDESIPLRANIVLVYDVYDIRSPLVTLVNSEGNIMPLNPNGTFTGILMAASLGSESVGVEWLYDTNGEKIEDEQD